jgi:hypothetical protein
MMTASIETVVKMMESVPESFQDQIVEKLRQYIADLEDEREWDTRFQQSQPQLVAAARQAKQEIAEGKASPMDYQLL